MNVYIYVLDTLADWELGFVCAELNSKRFFKKDAQDICIKMVGTSRNPIVTMGVLTITPDCLVDDIIVSSENMIILPGADTWSDSKHASIIKKASEFLSANACVAAICGATSALANFGVLDERPHTSNGLGFLEMMSPAYKGQRNYVDVPCVSDHHLISANSTASLQWTKHIIEKLDVFRPDTLACWFNYFSSGDANHFFALMETMQNEIQS